MVCLFLSDKAGKKLTTLFTGLDKVRFKAPVRPGDTLETVCSIIRAKKPFYFAKGEGYVNGIPCISAEFSFAIMENAEPAAT